MYFQRKVSKEASTPTQLRDLVKMVKNKNSANFLFQEQGKTSVMIAKILLNESKNILVFVPNDVVMDAWINNEIVECLDKNIFNDPIRLTGVEEIFEQKLEMLRMKITLNYHFYLLLIPQ